MKRAATVMVGIIFLAGTGYALAQDASAFLNKVNGNNDKTLSLRELNNYAGKKFDALNTTGQKSLSRQELGDRISNADFDKANTNHHPDQTLTKSEFVGYADRLFKEANTKGNRTLTVSELQSPAGARLITLLQ